MDHHHLQREIRRERRRLGSSHCAVGKQAFREGDVCDANIIIANTPTSFILTNSCSFPPCMSPRCHVLQLSRP